MEGWLEGDERLDYLLAEQLRIIQSPSAFSFSLDAVLLAKFASAPVRRGAIVDLCAGNGAIPLFLSARSQASIIGVELQERLAHMAQRSVAYNGLEGQIDILCADARGVAARIGYERYDLVTCNPPYFPAHEASDRNANEYFAIARHELYFTLADAVRSASELLKQGGKAAFVHRPERLSDFISAMRAERLEPKRLRLIYPKAGREANALLIEGIKDGRPGGLKVLPPLTVYEEGDRYTAEVQAILFGDDR